MVMKNFDIQLKNFEGKPVEEKDEKGVEKVVTIKDLVLKAIGATFPEEQSNGELKFKRFQTGLKVSAEGDQDYTPEELADIKAIVGKLYGPLVVGRIYEFLNS